MTDTAASFTQAIESLRLLREAEIRSVKDVPECDWDIIPNGLRNNLHWQLGHILTVHGSLLYRRCGAGFPFDPTYIDFFGKHTKPGDWNRAAPPVSIITQELASSVEHLERDLSVMINKQYPEKITVSNGFRLSSFADALLFLPIHDAIHLGAINVMRRMFLGESD